MHIHTWVNREQAQNLASNVNSGKCVDSTGIGNYYSSSWRVQNNGVRYSTDHGKTYKMGEYDKKSNGDVILTTGASESFAQMNIYDIAGNVWKLTLEVSNTSKIVTGRGSSFLNDTSTRSQASFRNDYNPTFNYYALGFRVML